MSFLANPTTANAKQLPTGVGRGFPPSSIADMRIERILRRGFMLDEELSANGNAATNQASSIAPRIALIGGFTPRRCGIAAIEGPDQPFQPIRRWNHVVIRKRDHVT